MLVKERSFLLYIAKFIIKAEYKTSLSNRRIQSKRKSGTLSLELTAHVLQANCEGGFIPQMRAIVEWKITICR